MRNLFFIFLLGILGTGCQQHYYYSPNTLHLPSVSQTGDINVEASLNGSQQIKGTELKSAWMFTKNTSLMANLMYLKGSFEIQTSFAFPPPPPEYHSGRGYLVEGGITRHFPLNEYTQFTMSGGWGIGNSRNDFDNGRIANLNFYRGFIQPALVSTGELATFGVGLRFSYLTFKGGDVDVRINDPELQILRKIDTEGPFWIPDLGLSGGIRLAPFQLKCNIGVSMKAVYTNQYSFANNNLNLALLYQFNHEQEKKNTKKKSSKKKKKKRK